MREPGAVAVVSSPDHRRAGVAAAAVMSLFTHVAVLAAAVHLGETAPVSVDSPQVSVAVEIVAVSPEPGGEDRAATDGSASADTADARAEAEAADADADADADAQTEAAPDAEADTEVTETEAAALAPPPEASHSVAESVTPERFEAPTRRPVLEPGPRQRQVEERAVVASPPVRPAEQQAAAEPTQQLDPRSDVGAGGDAGSDDSATTDMVVHAGGEGGGAAGAVPGPRFQAGAPGNPVPAYPEAARRWGYEGRVVVAVRVSAAGEPLAVDLAESSGYRVLDQAAVRAIRRWRFRPAGGGRPVDVVAVPITFKLED
ncbi:MAG: TonB family protein [Rhodospirillales bacterium]|nr:TonB family protein [Rhodospirillales bacterium]